MQLLYSQVVSGCVIFVVTLSCGVTPYLLLRRVGVTGSADVVRRTVSRLNSLQALACGIFIATCLLHLLPEAMEAIDKSITSDLPVAEMIVSFGFLLLLVLENSILACHERSHGLSDDPTVSRSPRRSRGGRGSRSSGSPVVVYTRHTSKASQRTRLLSGSGSSSSSSSRSRQTSYGTVGTDPKSQAVKSDSFRNGFVSPSIEERERFVTPYEGDGNGFVTPFEDADYNPDDKPDDENKPLGGNDSDEDIIITRPSQGYIQGYQSDRTGEISERSNTTRQPSRGHGQTYTIENGQLTTKEGGGGRKREGGGELRGRERVRIIEREKDRGGWEREEGIGGREGEGRVAREGEGVGEGKRGNREGGRSSRIRSNSSRSSIKQNTGQTKNQPTPSDGVAGPDLNNDTSTNQTTAAAAIKSFVLLIALSLHTVFDGLVVGLQRDEQSVWTLLAAVTLHKALVAVSISLSLLESHRHHPLPSLLYLLFFSLVAPVGLVVGVVLTDSSAIDERARDLTSGVLQSVATGTFMYVTFVESLKGRFDAGHRTLNVVLVLVGFALVAALRVLLPD